MSFTTKHNIDLVIQQVDSSLNVGPLTFGLI